MQIILRGKKVRTTVITKSLSKTEVDNYRPSAAVREANTSTLSLGSVSSSITISTPYRLFLFIHQFVLVNNSVYGHDYPFEVNFFVFILFLTYTHSTICREKRNCKKERRLQKLTWETWSP